MPILDVRVKDAVLAAAHKFSSLGATVSEVSIPFHPLGNAIWTIRQRISGYLTLQGKSHGRQGYGLVGLEAGKHPWTQESFEKCFPTTKNVLLNGMYLMDEFPALYNKSLNLSRKLKDAYEEVLTEYDVLILPTTSFIVKKKNMDHCLHQSRLSTQRWALLPIRCSLMLQDSLH
jgi:amidase